MTYSKKLRDPRWQKKRLKIMERDKFCCVHCGDSETTLNVHHKKYTGEPWDASNKALETVCEDCHSIINDIDSFKNDKELKLKEILKIKHNKGFYLVYVLGDGIVGEGIVVASQEDSFLIKKDTIIKSLKIINNG